jgi:hypothetical protein
MRRINAITLATMLLLISVNAGLAQEECIRCTQNYSYICSRSYGECVAACGSIATIDRNGCRRRCSAGNQGCGDRAALKCGTCKPEHFATPPPLRIQ